MTTTLVTTHYCDACLQDKANGSYIDNDNLWICNDCMDNADPDEGQCEGNYEDLALQEREAQIRREEQGWCKLNNVDSDQGHENEPITIGEDDVIIVWAPYSPEDDAIPF
jgi:hypothetical protein